MLYLFEGMARKRTPEEVRRLKKLGAFDVGRTYTPIGGFSRIPKQTYWDDPDPQDKQN